MLGTKISNEVGAADEWCSVELVCVCVCIMCVCVCVCVQIRIYTYTYVYSMLAEHQSLVCTNLY
jgi:hypothetical protein